MSEGEIAYMGDSAAGLDTFSSAGYPCKDNFNPADHFVFTLAIRPGSEETCRERCQHIIKHYKHSQFYSGMRDKLDSSSDDAPLVLIKDLR